MLCLLFIYTCIYNYMYIFNFSCACMHVYIYTYIYTCAYIHLSTATIHLHYKYTDIHAIPAHTTFLCCNTMLIAIPTITFSQPMMLPCQLLTPEHEAVSCNTHLPRSPPLSRHQHLSPTHHQHPATQTPTTPGPQRAHPRSSSQRFAHWCGIEPSS